VRRALRCHLCALCDGTQACGVRACVRACMRACPSACLSLCACVRAFVHVTAGTCGIYGSARDAFAARAFVASHALAAGAMWRCLTTSAPWAAREGHTTVIDAAGAIYVIGGYGSMNRTVFNDVWKSTDGGARPDSVGGGRRVLGKYSGVGGGALRGY
jgi:hypothetical protein